MAIPGDQYSYSATVIESRYIVSAVKRTPGYSIKVVATERTDGTESKEHELVGTLYFTDIVCGNNHTVAENTVNTLKKVFGWSGDWSALRNPEIFQDLECEILVTVNDKGYEEISFFNAPGGGRSEIKNLMSESEIDAFIFEKTGREAPGKQSTSAALRASASRSASSAQGSRYQNTPTRQSPAAQGLGLQPQEDDDDDLPF